MSIIPWILPYTKYAHKVTAEIAPLHTDDSKKNKDIPTFETVPFQSYLDRRLWWYEVSFKGQQITFILKTISLQR
jgi:hypothetical protein